MSESQIFPGQLDRRRRVCGTSIGSLVGAAYAAGELNRFEEWVLDMRIKDVIRFMDLSLGGGLLKGNRVMEFFRLNFVDRKIEELQMPFGAVATALHSGGEVWLRDGSTVDAVRASIALPGFLTPVMRDGIVLVDGGLVNPVPVSLARAMGADVVIAVDLNSFRIASRFTADKETGPPSEPPESATVVGVWVRRLQQNLGALIPASPADQYKPPSMQEVLFSSIDIMQERITRSRLAGEPPDFLVTPRLAQMSLFDSHRAKEGIEEGKRAVAEILPNLRRILLPTA